MPVNVQRGERARVYEEIGRFSSASKALIASEHDEEWMPKKWDNNAMSVPENVNVHLVDPAASISWIGTGAEYDELVEAAYVAENEQDPDCR